MVGASNGAIIVPHTKPLLLLKAIEVFISIALQFSQRIVFKLYYHFFKFNFKISFILFFGSSF